MALRLHNTLTRSIEELEPIEPGVVRVYACGPTVYREPHIGNFRTFLFNDLLHRYLRWKGFDVRFVMNLTDVDDKTIDGALARGIRLAEHTKPIIEAFLADLKALGVVGPVEYPRATEHIDEMVTLVQRLLDGQHAYQAGDGSVYFDISSFPDYGRLSRIDLAGTRPGAGLEQRERVASNEYAKEDARDFVLWKAARDPDRQVGAVWETPWGEGRPGWHIECSAMSMGELGESFDIHTGGEDLIFPHHEDEIAQSEAATGKPFVRCWLHVKHLLVESAKMSKSKGNVYTLEQLRGMGHSNAAMRYLLLSAHYRSELNFTLDGLDDARAAIRRVADFRDRLAESGEVRSELRRDGPSGRRGEEEAAAGAGMAAATGETPAESALAAAAERALEGFEAALDDDLNVPVALASLFTFVREGNAALDTGGDGAAARERALEALRRMDDVLGFLELHDAASGVDEDFAAWVEERIERRQQARRSRDFAAADAIRDELTAAGVVVEDTPGGPRWKRGPGAG